MCCILKRNQISHSSVYSLNENKDPLNKRGHDYSHDVQFRSLAHHILTKKRHAGNDWNGIREAGEAGILRQIESSLITHNNTGRHSWQQSVKLAKKPL